MFCTHCKYTSFDYLPSCPRCGRDWTQEKKALNLDWLVASAPEGKHQRQVDQGEANASFAGAASETWSAPLPTKPDSKQPTAPSSRPRSYPPQDLEEVHTLEGRPRDQKQSLISNDQDFNENELDFPELDELLQPQDPPGPQPPPSGSTAQDTPDRSASNPSGASAGPKQEDEDEDFLDLSSLVHDLGLDMDESDDAKSHRNQRTSSQSSPNKSPHTE